MTLACPIVDTGVLVRFSSRSDKFNIISKPETHPGCFCVVLGVFPGRDECGLDISGNGIL
jgi:hypothetical protein